MHFTFKTNKNYLFAAALKGDLVNDEWNTLRNKYWKGEYRLGYEMLSGYLNSIFLNDDINSSLKEAVLNLQKLLEEGTQTPEFKKLYKETVEYCTWLEKEWESKKDKVTKELEDILRIDISNLNIDVIVIHPDLFGGRIIDKNTIEWGHSEDWPNYSVVYLVHEAMHTILGTDYIEHAVIQLIADNELRIRLNGEGDYFYINGELVGHKYIHEIEQKLLPSWQKYLTDDSKNIHDFVREIHAQLKRF